MRPILKVIDTISSISGRAVSIFVVLFMVLIGFEVVARYVFHSPTIWVMESVTLMCGMYSILGGAYTLYIGGHVSVDAIYGRFSPRVKAGIDLFTFPVAIFFLLVLIWTSGTYAWESTLIFEDSGSAAHLPIYPVKIALFLATLMFALQMLAKFIRDFIFVVTGREYK